MNRFNDSTSDQVGEYYQAQSWRREGVKEERERIIKLLEELKEFWSEKMTLEYGEATMINVDEAIALIKGEN
jgi:hypothetical protein